MGIKKRKLAGIQVFTFPSVTVCRIHTVKRGGTAQAIPPQLQDLRKLEYRARDDLEKCHEVVNSREP